MAYYPRYRRLRSRRPFYSSRKRSQKKRGKKSSSSTSFSKKVLKVVHRASETKQLEPKIVRGNVITNWLNDNAIQCIPLTPSINLGTGQGDRIGNQVSTRRAVLSLNLECISITSASGYAPPIYFDIYIYKYKRSNTQSAVELRKFLQYGNTSTDFKSNTLPESQNLKVNNDTFTLKAHKRVLCWAQTYSQASTPSGGALTNCRNITNAKNLNIDITKFLSKNMKFQDATTNTPNDNLYVSVVGTPNDHNTSYVDGFQLGVYDAMVQYQYDDL